MMRPAVGDQTKGSAATRSAGSGAAWRGLCRCWTRRGMRASEAWPMSGTEGWFRSRAPADGRDGKPAQVNSVCAHSRLKHRPCA